MASYSSTLLSIIDKAVAIKGIAVADMERKPTPGKWSKKEILGHLIDSAYNNHARFLIAEKQGNLIFSGYDQVEWVKRNNYQEQDRSEIFQAWSVVNTHLSRLINSIPDHILSNLTTEHNFHKICFNLLQEGAPSNLSYLIWDYLDHMEHHLVQIIPDYKVINLPFETYPGLLQAFHFYVLYGNINPNVFLPYKAYRRIG